MKIEKILWPTDFSANAERALPYVQSLTRQYGAEIIVGQRIFSIFMISPFF